MGAESQKEETQRLRQQRDLYLRLLTLGAQDDIERFLSEALELLVEVTGARHGYLEVREGDAPEACWMAQGYSDDDLDEVRSAISRGILAQALASGQTVVTHSARLDPRFRDRGSVQASAIEAVLCTPIGADPWLGAIYLEAPAAPGFSKIDVEQAELVARHLAPTAEHLLARRRVEEESDPTRPLRQQLRVEGVIGRSEALAEVLRQAALVAPLDVSVLLTGDSGTGKNQIARAIHDNGPRHSGPFVEVNCAALPEELLENELFGSMPGAHSTAQRESSGKVQAAESGTLFLDEVGEMSHSAQAKLPKRANLRIIAATNTDLEDAVRQRRFREDLLYRLQVLPIRLPSLAERVEDVPQLASFFCASACERHGLQRLELSVGALHAIRAAEWPGNVRQLAHAVEAAAIRAAGEGARRAELRHVFPGDPGASEQEPPTYQEATRRFQCDLLRRTLEDTGWNIAETARRLDLARSHVYNLISAFGLEREKR
jgi:Nif-specific regulatory protein